MRKVTVRHDRWIGMSLFLFAGAVACVNDEAVAPMVQTSVRTGPGVSSSNEMSQAALRVQPGAPGTGLNYLKCADEGGTCLSSQLAYLAYGAENSFAFNFSHFVSAGAGTMPCTNQAFGTNPSPGKANACYTTFFTLKGEEDFPLHTVDTRIIAYGANGVFNFGVVNGEFNCNNGTFGDPAPNVRKLCLEGLPGYAWAANEGGTLTGLDRTPVAYGMNGSFTFGIFSGTVNCTNKGIGSDPAVGLVKMCFRLSASEVADEGGSFDAGAKSTRDGGARNIFYYTSGLNGYVLPKELTGNTTCSNTTFAADPDPGIVKHCYKAHL